MEIQLLVRRVIGLEWVVPADARTLEEQYTATPRRAFSVVDLDTGEVHDEPSW